MTRPFRLCGTQTDYHMVDAQSMSTFFYVHKKHNWENDTDFAKTCAGIGSKFDFSIKTLEVRLAHNGKKYEHAAGEMAFSSVYYI